MCNSQNPRSHRQLHYLGSISVVELSYNLSHTGTLRSVGFKEISLGERVGLVGEF